ncbi:hypothetical protein GQ43DRAFT_487093 [Delitschia confertaspora ATCC 74209]|uniref:DUF2415 domain-containing protein n=1 Tax=Delitschia confertaspora ATCC 74209 TaxID=1513339 RepID=A0A9P4MSX5_9PLEO|nr:hypothetical protein GQ43DRAFT_487093 [Delitschia confertaspora ATCC 74209]
MAVDDSLLCRHYQLRHFISSAEQDLLYYASGPDVYCINVATKIQAHITTLPFDARCTASGFGWICVGGAENGNFAAIKVAGFPPVDSSEIDETLPLNLPTRPSDLSSRIPLPRPPRLSAMHRLRLEKIGEDIVNSISIHNLETEGDGEDEVVAVLTNNDKTVRLYSLTHNLEVSVLDLPFPMNHATISPDGKLLVAVGDNNQAFFFARSPLPKSTTTKTPQGRTQQLPHDWVLFYEAQLYVPSGTACLGYFTTAWSTSGRLVAVGSECGYITVFDVDLLKHPECSDEAALRIIQSTKPDYNAGAGAVRTMLFSPPPWDLLIWSEDQATVCVADIRSGLKTRQVLSLDPTEEGLEKIEVVDFDVELSPELRDLRQEADFLRRYRRALDPEGSVAAVNFATEYIEASERRRSHRQLGVVESDNDPHGLTAHERQILEALRSGRQREEAREQRATPRSINYTATGPGELRRYAINGPEFPTRIPSNRSRDRFFTRLDATTDPTSLQESMTDSTRQLDILSAPTIPRRQASVVFSNGASSSAAENNGGNISDAARTRSPNPIPPHARRADPQIISATDDAWRTIEDAMARNTQSQSRFSGAPELRSELRRLRQLTQQRERLRSARDAGSRVLQPHELVEQMAVRTGAPSRRHRGHDPSDGLRTAGLAMSQNGRKLYCGTEEGIFEFDINVVERKSFPAVVPR